MLRSALAVLAGIAVLTVASFAIEWTVNPLLMRMWPEAFPTPEALSKNLWVTMFTFAYSLVCVAAGGFVAARIAQRLPVRHAGALGIVQMALTVMAMVSMPQLAPLPIWITGAILTFPAALAGGVAYSRNAEPAR